MFNLPPITGLFMSSQIADYYAHAEIFRNLRSLVNVADITVEYMYTHHTVHLESLHQKL